ncbi:SDR family oxidoreductase [Spiractinospora alimapuensis]|uniref:NAD(P)-dependent oxidoreductase n=1 Tax=Spiractinospora alimapuensis TaxID=2820884 RepID=UPI001F2840FF|nr:NAD(P)-binding oxidoreductase [Spiractinospora alimapuensis]QVQ54384.1 SDR family oxidoreductase [Spiractinospora alimapuensis]
MTHPHRLLIIGASGRTGRLLTRLAVADGYDVTVLVRDPGSLRDVSGVHRTVVGDATDPSAVAEAVNGQDAVITVVSAPDRKPSTVVSDVTRTLLTEMTRAGVRRLVVTSSRNVAATKPWPVIAPIKWFFRHVYADLVRAEDLVWSSELDWTIVRAVMLCDDPAQGHVHIDREPNPTGGHWKLTRDDYARVLLDTVRDPDTTRVALGVNGPTQGGSR